MPAAACSHEMSVLHDPAPSLPPSSNHLHSGCPSVSYGAMLPHVCVVLFTSIAASVAAPWAISTQFGSG